MIDREPLTGFYHLEIVCTRCGDGHTRALLPHEAKREPTTQNNIVDSVYIAKFKTVADAKRERDQL